MSACPDHSDHRAALAAELLEDSGFVDALIASESVPRSGIALHVLITPGTIPTTSSYHLSVTVLPATTALAP